jgi:translation initiation factor IF-3
MTAAQQKAREEHFKKHPFQFHLLRFLDNGEIVHINSLFKGYNCTPDDLTETDNNFRKKVICNSPEEVSAIINNPNLKGRQMLYILYPLDYKMLKEYKKDIE